MNRILRWLLPPLAFGLLLAAAYFPLPVRPYLDFQVIYHADLGLLRGISLYDRAGQMKMVADLAGVQPGQVKIHPFPYPPWYALATLPLGLLPIKVAARLWLELNVAMLMLSVWLMTNVWKHRYRLVAFPLSILFLPVLGSLFVGQYVFPVILGMSLLAYALCKEKPLLTALAAVLLTFKPHLGVPVLLVGLFHLFLRRDAFSKRALWATIIAGALIFGVGFLADPLWPLNYMYSLMSYRSLGGVSSCDICVSLPVMLLNLIGLRDIQYTFLLTGVLFLAFVGIFLWKGQKLLLLPDWPIGAYALITLLISPYLLNYDFILLLVPLFFMASRIRTWVDGVMLGLIYFLPWFGLGLFGRQGNITLILSALLLTGWLFQRMTNCLTSPSQNCIISKTHSGRSKRSGN